MSYKIREVDGAEEADEIRELHDACFGNEAPPVDPCEDLWWLVFLDRGAVGFAALRASLGEYHAGYLYRSGVLPEHRGRSLQLRLIRARERKARSLGWRILRTDTTDNPASSNTLIKAGYRIFTPEVPWAFSNSIYWRKELH